MHTILRAATIAATLLYAAGIAVADDNARPRLILPATVNAPAGDIPCETFKCEIEGDEEVCTCVVTRPAMKMEGTGSGDITTVGAANGGTVAACNDWHAAGKAHSEAPTQETLTALAAAARAVLRTVENNAAAATIKQLQASADSAGDAESAAVIWAAFLPGDVKVWERTREARNAAAWARDSALMYYCLYR